MKKGALYLIGAICLVVGFLLRGQSWTTPEMFKGLGLDLAMTITNVGLFLIFAQVINTYFYSPLKEAMDARNGELEKTFGEAEDLRTEMTKMKSDYEARLAATEADARTKIQAQIKEAQTLRQTLMSEAASKADEFLKKAQDEIEQEKVRVMTEIRVSVVDLTLKAAEKVIGENMDSDKNRRLVTEFIEKVEVGR